LKQNLTPYSNLQFSKETPMTVILPSRKIHKTPRLLRADAYTIGADLFQCQAAKEKSVYYVTFRRQLESIDPSLYDKGDDRMIFVGLQRILEELFYEPITHDEIDETKNFLSTFRATTQGLKPYHFNETMWRTIVDEYNGRPPIKIEAVPEGSVVYPNEPVIQITCGVEGEEWGELAAYFESKILHVYATSERATANRHWFKYLCNMIKDVDPSLPLTAGPGEDSVFFFASILCHDFGDRAGFTGNESEVMGMTHLYSFCGTDTSAGAYQAWKQANEVGGIATSVYALAHRNVQAWDSEKDCYVNLYEKAEYGDFLSNVADCYNFKNAVVNMLLPLAIRSQENNEGKIIVARPDSGNAMEQVLFVLDLAVEHGLYTEKNGYKYSTTLKVIEGDGMTWTQMREIIEEVTKRGFSFFSFCIFGVGGGLRNGIKRDNFSAKYALAAASNNDDGVIKLSEVEGKHTLPGPFALLRGSDALANKQTVVHPSECDEDDNHMIVFFDGTNINKPFGDGQDDTFMDIKDRIQNKFDDMPLNLRNDKNNFPASPKVLAERDRLAQKHNPQN
jgi:nicotinic acid phosphoribosyltransferase